MATILWIGTIVVVIIAAGRALYAWQTKNIGPLNKNYKIICSIVRDSKVERCDC